MKSRVVEKGNAVSQLLKNLPNLKQNDWMGKKWKQSNITSKEMEFLKRSNYEKKKKWMPIFLFPPLGPGTVGCGSKNSHPLKGQQVNRMQRQDNEGISREEFEGKRHYTVQALSFDNIGRNWSFRWDERVDRIKRYTEMYDKSSRVDLRSLDI